MNMKRKCIIKSVSPSEAFSEGMTLAFHNVPNPYDESKDPESSFQMWEKGRRLRQECDVCGRQACESHFSERPTASHFNVSPAASHF